MIAKIDSHAGNAPSMSRAGLAAAVEHARPEVDADGVVAAQAGCIGCPCCPGSHLGWAGIKPVAGT